MISLAIKQLAAFRHGAAVQRFHTHRMVNRETVGEHSFGVAGLVWILTDGQCSRELLMAALVHDLPEQEIGDIPAPTKRALGGEELAAVEDKFFDSIRLNFDLSSDEFRTLKLADIMDGMLTCVGEARLGNLALGGCFETYRGYGLVHICTQLEAQIWEYIIKEWEYAISK